MQDNAPVEGMAVEGAEAAPDAPMDSGSMSPGAAGEAPDGAVLADSGEGNGGEFPAGDDMPFEGAAADDGTPQGVEPGEPSAPPPTPELWEQQLDAKGDSLAYTDAGELGLYAGRRLLAAVPAEGGAYGAATEEEVAEMLDEVFGHI